MQHLIYVEPWLNQLFVHTTSEKATCDKCGNQRGPDPVLVGPLVMLGQGNSVEEALTRSAGLEVLDGVECDGCFGTKQRLRMFT